MTTDPRIDLRNPVLAAALAFLFPGAGHAYQRRYFKAAIYCVCILGIFFWGWSLGEAKTVHFQWDTTKVTGNGGSSRKKTIGFLAQVGVGVMALPAVAQEMRYTAQLEDENSDRRPGVILEEIDAEFTGKLNHVTLGHADITGQITGVLRVGDYGFGTDFEGTFSGQTSNGDSVQLELLGSRTSGSLELGDRVTGLDDVTMSELVLEKQAPDFAGDRRRLFVRVVDKTADLGMIEGSIPRPFYNHYLAPLDDESLQYLNGKLGKQYELALVYTWIAGLLNILAVWDAFQGPAYGYGDEEPEPDEKASDKSGDKEAEASEAETTNAGASS